MEKNNDEPMSSLSSSKVSSWGSADPSTLALALALASSDSVKKLDEDSVSTVEKEDDTVQTEPLSIAESEESTRKGLHQHLVRGRLVGSRRRRKEEIRSAYLSPDLVEERHVECFPNSDYPLLTLVFQPCDMWSWFEDDDDTQKEPVVVVVEAAALCRMDVGMKCTEDIVLSTLLESHFVGVVRECPDDAEEMYGITRGSRVASIYPWGANAKFVSVPVDSLVAVPKDLEAADLSCLFSFYLPAFQILHHGRGRPYRYSRPCLKGRRLLITGGASLMAQAVIRLAKLAKAGEIFVTAPREHHLILTRLGVAALDEKPDSWLPVVDHSMDIVLDFEFPKHFSSIQQALSPKGRLVCSPQSRSDADGFSCIPSRLVNIFELFKLSGVKRATFFDFAVENAEQNRDGLWEDMKFLVKHLFSRQIRPQIDRIITLKDIPQVFREMQKREEPLSGAIICEPWKPY